MREKIHPDTSGKNIDFAWIFFICTTKLGLNAKEAGRLSINEFTKLYKVYKRQYNLETTMRLNNITYEDLEEQQEQYEEVISF